MANKLAGQRAKFSKARATFYSTSDDTQRHHAAELMAEVLAEAPANGFTEDEVTQGADVPDEARQLSTGVQARPQGSEDDPDELVAELQTAVDTADVLEIGEGDKSLTLLLLRRDDFLALELQFVNLRLEGTPARLVRIDPAEAAFVIVWFPAQHLMEQAFLQGAEDIPGPVPVPVLALHAGPSRLVFMLPEDRDDLPLTLESVLDWNALTPALAPNALPPGATAGPPPAEPNILQTAIEFPAGLVLSPDATGGWAHTVAPVTRNGRTELWHSRLGVRDEDPGGGHEVDESALPHLRAIWSTPLGVLFKSSLDDDKRAQIVRLSSDFSLQAHPPLPQGFNPQFVQVWKAELQQRGIPLTYTPRPIDAERFMLTGAGAWARLQSTWDYPTIIDEADERFTGYPQLTLEQWQHIAGGGRDQYVRTVERGFLCPTGNRASLVTITERQFVPVFLGSEGGVGIFGGQGVLCQFQFIVVQEPEQDYAAVASAFEHEGREMPLRRIRILTRETPKLDAAATRFAAALTCQRSTAGLSLSRSWPRIGKGRRSRWRCRCCSRTATGLPRRPSVTTTMPLLPPVGARLPRTASASRSLRPRRRPAARRR